MKSFHRIELNPRVCNGKPVIRGTRIPVSVILDEVASGASWDEILKGYPEISRADIQASIQYASALVENSDVREVHA
jgi:uncharacterized protein (DUF433 family)